MIYGSAAIIIEEAKILMVQQGAEYENLTWTIPSGEKNPEETFEECCIRETYEETGLTAIIRGKFISKETDTYKIVYYICDKVTGQAMINDPDNLIYDIRWFSVEELKSLEFSFEEDRKILSDLLASCQ